MLPLHHSPKDFFKLGGLENSVKIKGRNPKSEDIEPRMEHGLNTDFQSVFAPCSYFSSNQCKIMAAK